MAAHCLYEGLIEEGLAIVKGVRDRHDGEKRNPWDEFECGHHYARAMSSWSLLLALSGYHYDAERQHLAFAPKVNADDFRCFFSAGKIWGQFTQRIEAGSYTATLESRYDTDWKPFFTLQTLRLPLPEGTEGQEVSADIDGRPVPVRLTEPGLVAFDPPLTFDPEQTLSIKIARL